MGNTLQFCQHELHHKDHPHIHGEHARCGFFTMLIEGSPPHTWGTLADDRTKQIEGRITPTYMGNTERVKRLMEKFKDHPHIHGEHIKETISLEVPSGSPPHTWGTLPGISFWFVEYRITPTYMGNTKILEKAPQQL